ncbi:MAG TPA: protein kinase [Terriglobales bacterium]|nr:protein kinase [Terriglobales bacterium]
MALTSSARLGPYEIVALLGAGGMGEVYRAVDTRLGRDVAIKVLPQGLTKDPDRLRRFEQEARTIAALNHPNILGIHDIGTHDGAPFLVSELLEGQTLREKLEAGPLPVRRAIEYALGIAQGLAAAHDKGIVHRDLKPENVFITRDGRVKVLDFGLAKLVRPEESHDTVATLASPATLPGMVLGTVGYMSPEQVRGESTDARSDIFSFGAVLYEMLTGKRAFKRETSAETMTAVLREEPPELNETGWQGPLGLQRILTRCLEKGVERRFQSASDLAFAIESLGGTSSTRSVAQSKGKRAWLPWTAVALGTLALAAGLWLLGRWSAAKPQPKFTRLTYRQGYLSNARFAKDGQTVVYSAQWNNEPLQIYSVRMEFPQSTKVDLPSATLFSLSANGDMELAVDPVSGLYFLSGTMAQAPMAGGTPRSQEKDVIAADYAPDGKTLALVRLANRKVQLEYPAGKVIYATAGYLDYVRVSPSGKEVAFVEHPVYGDDRGWVSVFDATGDRKQLTREYATLQGLAWSRNGKEIWFTASDSTDRQLYGVSLGGKQREILTTPQGTRILDVAADGRVLVSSEQHRTEITGIDPVTGRERHGLEWFDGSMLGDISPDGKAIVFLEWGGPAGPLYLTVYRKLDGSPPVALGPGGTPRFSPDGTTVATKIVTRPPQVGLNPIGTGESRRLPVGDITSLGNVIWFPDGKHLLLTGATEGQSFRSYEMDLEGGKPRSLGPPDFIGGAIAKDGKRIAGRNASAEAVVFDRETQKLQGIPGVEPQDQLEKWTEDGKGLLVVSATPSEARIYRVDMPTGKRTLLQTMEPSEKAGSNQDMRLVYAEHSKTYAYSTVRVLGTLYVVEGLE